jgi:hypothetical protein
MAYKIRKFESGTSKSGSSYVNYSVTIPREVAEKLPKDVAYECELTEDGILFRPSAQKQETELPTWAKDAGNGDKPKPKRSRKAVTEKAPDTD